MGFVSLKIQFYLKHVPRGRMGKVDGLSKRSNWEVGMERDNEEQVLVKIEWLEVRVAEVTKVVIDGVNILDKIRRSKAKYNEVVKVVEDVMTS